jgi:hypothetical protein
LWGVVADLGRGSEWLWSLVAFSDGVRVQKIRQKMAKCVAKLDRDQGSGIRDQGSGIRDQGSGIRDQGSGIRDQGSGIREE